jgi:hypothetical protein
LAKQEKTVRKLHDYQAQIDVMQCHMWISARVLELAHLLSKHDTADNHFRITGATCKSKSSFLDAKQARALVPDWQAVKDHLVVMLLALVNSICAAEQNEGSVFSDLVSFVDFPHATLRASVGLSLALGGTTKDKILLGARLLVGVDLATALPSQCMFANAFYVLKNLSASNPVAASEYARSLVPRSAEQAAMLVKARLMEDGAMRDAVAMQREFCESIVGAAGWRKELVGEVLAPWMFTSGSNSNMVLNQAETEAVEDCGLAPPEWVCASRLNQARFVSARRAAVQGESPVALAAVDLYEQANPAVLRVGEEGKYSSTAEMVSEWFTGGEANNNHKAGLAVVISKRRMELLDRATKKRQERGGEALAALPPPPPEEQEVSTTAAMKRLTITHRPAPANTTSSLKEKISRIAGSKRN